MHSCKSGVQSNEKLVGWMSAQNVLDKQLC